MSEESDFEVLTREVEDLRKQVKDQGTQLKILAVFVLAVMIVSYMISASEIGFIIIVAIIVLPIALCCNSLEQSGI
jgi:hypothetical protein